MTFPGRNRMTIFFRSGHWRTSKNGKEYWVEPHYVERNDWGRSSYDHSRGIALHNLISLKATRSATSCFVEPNATCPVCGAYVFYYQNAHGSRVFFDELGPPWPKHPCTDSKEEGRRDKIEYVYPVLRDNESLRSVKINLNKLDRDYQEIFREQYGSEQWGCWKVISLEENRFVLSSIKDQETRIINMPPSSIKLDSIIFLQKNKLAYFDIDEMTPVEIEVDQDRTIV